MDVNYILTREQIELSLARASTDTGTRAAHQGMADRYRGMVADYRRDNVAAGAFAAAAPSAT